MKVEELFQYGKTLSGLPREAVRKQEAIVFREIRKKFGLLGMVPFFIRVLLEQRNILSIIWSSHFNGVEICDTRFV